MVLKDASIYMCTKWSWTFLICGGRPRLLTTRGFSFFVQRRFHHPVKPTLNLISPFFHSGQLLIRRFWGCDELMMLCEHCSRINLFPSEAGKSHHETVEKLHQSVLDGCEFCRVIYDGLEQRVETDDDLFYKTESYLRYGYNVIQSVLKFEAERMDAEAEIRRFQTVSFRVYIDEGVSCY